MAQFVVERHAHGAETHGAEPGAVLGFGAGVGVVGVVDDDGEGFGEGFGAFEGEEGHDGVVGAGVEGFDWDVF